MLKTEYKNKLYFITQPDHAKVSGYFAAHWGNKKFTRPGYYADSQNPEKLRAETVLGIAEHDNGWWEWEASPEPDTDGLPKGLGTVLKNQQEGMNRWRIGIPRLSEKHPYASLLISYHAYWLYAHSSGAEKNPAFIHPLFWKGSNIYSEDSSPELTGETLKNALNFVEELKEIQKSLIDQINKDKFSEGWLEIGALSPHARLIQILDGLSLSICSNLIPAREGKSMGLGQDEFDLLDVPRKSWDDRVTIKVFSKGEGKIVCDPYPFDLDPLKVSVSARIIESVEEEKSQSNILWHAGQTELIEYELSSS